MTPYLIAADRYHRDPLFATVIDSLTVLIAKVQMTPTEVRDAAIYACLRFEERNIRALYMDTHGNRVLDAHERAHMAQEADAAALRLHHLQEWLGTVERLERDERKP